MLRVIRQAGKPDNVLLAVPAGGLEIFVNIVYLFRRHFSFKFHTNNNYYLYKEKHLAPAHRF